MLVNFLISECTGDSMTMGLLIGLNTDFLDQPLGLCLQHSSVELRVPTLEH